MSVAAAVPDAEAIRAPRAPGRVAYVVGLYPAYSHTFIQREVTGLRAAGWVVDTFSIHPSGDAHASTPEDRRERDATLAVLDGRVRVVLRVARALARAAAHGGGLKRALRRGLALRRPGLRASALQLAYLAEALVVWDACARRGVRHLHAHHLNQAADVALLATELGGDGWTWSLTVHGPDELADVSRFNLAAKVRHAAFVACISDFCRSQLMAQVGPEHWEKLAIVHCGVDPELWRPPRRRQHTGGPLRVLNVGRHVPAKGHGVLLDALALIRREGLAVELTLIGDGPYRSTLEARARALGVEEAVHFAGRLGQDRVRRAFADADLFCLSSFAEGVPVVLMEAMAMELPVVATRIMGIPELIADGRDGLLLPPGRVDALAGALRRLATDPAERRRLGVAGRRTVEASFDCRREAARLGTLLSGVLGERP